MWKSVPNGKDYLTASVLLVDQLYEQVASKLSRTNLTSMHLQWRKGGMLLERCEHTARYSCNCSPPQQIISGNCGQLRRVLEPSILKENGAVTFGQESNRLISTISALRKPEVKQDDILYSQLNVELGSIHTSRSSHSDLPMEPILFTKSVYSLNFRHTLSDLRE
jgi:hypothetical protein